MAVLAGGYPVSEADVCPFTDVVNGGRTTFYPDNFIAVCAAKGITAGKTPSTFDPYSDITRYQVTSMVVRMADNLKPGLLATPPPGWTATGAWDSDGTHGANAARAEYNGLLAGLDLSALDAVGDMTRGEVAQMLYNLLVKLGQVEPSTTTTAPSTTTSSTIPVTPVGFEDLGGAITSAPAACSMASGLIDVFARGATGSVVHASWDGANWSGWEDLGGSAKAGSDPAAVSWGPGRIDVFIRGTDDALWHKWWDGDAWSDWESLGGILTAGPAAAYRATGGDYKSLDVFIVGSDNRLWHRTFDGISWGAWAALGTGGPDPKAGFAPAAVTWGAVRIDLFVCGTDGALWHSYLSQHRRLVALGEPRRNRGLQSGRLHLGLLG